MHVIEGNFRSLVCFISFPTQLSTALYHIKPTPPSMDFYLPGSPTFQSFISYKRTRLPTLISLNGIRYVLWADIQNAFEGVTHLRSWDNESVSLFMTDEDAELYAMPFSLSMDPHLFDASDFFLTDCINSFPSFPGYILYASGMMCSHIMSGKSWGPLRNIPWKSYSKRLGIYTAFSKQIPTIQETYFDK